jgi:membrane fusion protein, adhesin transport system
MKSTTLGRMKDMFTPLYDDVMEDPFGDGGEPRVTRRQRWLLYAIASCFVVFLGWSMLAEVDEVAKAQGKVVPSSIADKIMPNQPAKVTEVLVNLGGAVVKDQLLLRMQPTIGQTDMATAESRYYALLAKQERLQAESEGREPVFPKSSLAKAPDAVASEKQSYESNKSKNNNQLQTLKEQKQQRENELEQIEQQIKDTTSQEGLAAQEVGMLAPLVREGAAAKRDLLRAQQSLAAARSEKNRLTNARPTAQAALREAESRIAEFDTTFKAEAQAQLSQLASEIGPLEAAVKAARGELPAIEIRAPRAGKVQLLTVTEGSVVQPGQQQPMLEIVPEGETLVVEAMVRPADIAFIRPQLDANVKITAYDFSIYGGLDAKVQDISPDTITNERGESFYRVRLQTLQNCFVDRKGNCRTGRRGESLIISTGMTAEVDIITGRKTVWDYLMKPFIKAGRNALTER